MMHAENCQRCQKTTNGVTIMSMFNTQVICMDCKKEEKENPRYAEAVEADVQEIKKGNYNFEGIGLG
jgi:predicted aldo/keto reductase-like oxidoreductase